MSGHADALAAAADALEAAAAALRRAAEAPAPSEGPDRLLSVEEASRALGVGRSTVYAELGAGRLRSVRVGRRRLIPAAAVAERMAAP
jgi:excisionase family DNA binding protein